MRTTLALDDELVAKARAYTGLREMSALVSEALKALIERESALRLARLGDSEPQLAPPASASPRRRVILAAQVVPAPQLGSRPGSSPGSPG